MRSSRDRTVALLGVAVWAAQLPMSRSQAGTTFDTNFVLTGPVSYASFTRLSRTPVAGTFYSSASFTATNPDGDYWSLCIGTGTACTSDTLSIDNCVRRVPSSTSDYVSSTSFDSGGSVSIPTGVDSVCLIAQCRNRFTSCSSTQFSATVSVSGYRCPSKCSGCSSATTCTACSTYGDVVDGGTCISVYSVCGIRGMCMLTPDTTVQVSSINGVSCPLGSFSSTIVNSAGTVTCNPGPVCGPCLSAGATCIHNEQCGSNVCRAGRCCSDAAKTNCAACTSTGTCSACNPGTSCTLSIPPGGTCSSSSQCSGGNACLGGNCCRTSSPTSGCASCGTDGNCATCNSPNVLTGSGSSATCAAPVQPKSAGSTCSSNAECSSNKCLGSKCCSTSSPPSGCASCGTDGNCATCTSPSVLIGSGSSATCGAAPLKAAGASCSASAECTSNKCLSGFCCDASASSNCNACSNSGTCTRCASGFFLNNGACASTGGVQPGGTVGSGLTCAVAGNIINSVCCASMFCSSCSSGTGACTSCANGAAPGCTNPSGGSGAGGSSCSSSSDCASGVCSNSVCSSCARGFALYQDQCTASNLIPASGTPSGGSTTTAGTSGGTSGSTSGGSSDSNTPAAVVVPDATATLTFRRKSVVRRELALSGVHPCVDACASSGLSISVSASGDVTLKPFLSTTTVSGAACTCGTVSGSLSSSSSKIAGGTFTQPDGSTASFAALFDPSGYVNFEVTAQGSLVPASYSYYILSCYVKSATSALSTSLCKATVSLGYVSGGVEASISGLPTEAQTMISCFDACLKGGLSAVAVGASTVVFSPRDANPSSTCTCPALPGEMQGNLVSAGSPTDGGFEVTAGTTTPRLTFKLNNNNVGSYQYRAESCLGPSEFCTPYVGSTPSTTTGKRASNYVSDTLVSAVDSCTRLCLVSGYYISVSGSTAILTPIVIKPVTGCTCASLTGSVSSGVISGTGALGSGGASVGFSVSAPGSDQVALSLKAADGSALGAVSFASAGCTSSSTNFCGDAPPPPPSSSSSANIGAIVGGVLGGLVAVAVLAGAAYGVYYYMNNRGESAGRNEARRNTGGWEPDPVNKASAVNMVHDNPLVNMGGGPNHYLPVGVQR